MWKKVEELEKEDKEKAEEFYQEQNMGITLSIEKFQQNARHNRSFLEQHAPQVLQLYDDFVRYIIANVKEDDTLGFDVLEIVSMDELPIAPASTRFRCGCRTGCVAPARSPPTCAGSCRTRCWPTRWAPEAPSPRSPPGRRESRLLYC